MFQKLKQKHIILHTGQLLFYIAILILCVAVKIPGASATTACSVDAQLVNSCRPWIGAATGGYTMAPGGSGADAQFSFFEKRMNNPNVLSSPNLAVNINNQLDFVHSYHTPTQTSLKAPEITYGGRAGTYLQINWKPASSWADASGGNASVNASIDAFANTIKALAPKKVLLSVFHEPENDVTTGSAGACTTKAGANTGTPTDYVNMWHNVRARFDAKGVNNVVWAINYMGFSNWNCLVPLLWPGNSYVDWVVWDPYAGGSGSFTSSVQTFYNFLTSSSDATHNYLSKNWGLGEFGYWNNSGDSTEAGAVSYWNDAKSTIENDTFPKIKLYSTFDTNADAGGSYTTPSMIGYNTDGSISIAEQTAYNGFVAAIMAKEPVPDTTDPSVSFANPPDGASVSGTINIAINASDNVGVTGVDMYYDDTHLIKSDSNAGDGWSTSWNSTNVSNGSHSLKAVAHDAAGNTATKTINITVNNATPSPVISSFTASPVSLTSGSTTTLSWVTSNTISCSITPGGPTDTTATSWTTLGLTEVGTKTFTLTCKNSSGTTTSKTITITVNAPLSPPSNVLLSASSTSVAPGASVTLSWTSVGSSNCVLNPGSYSASGAASSKTLQVSSSTNYNVTCTNSAGSTTSSAVTVSVSTSPNVSIPPVISSFTASKDNVATGTSVTLSWLAGDVAPGGCNLAPSPLISTSSAGSWTTPPLTASVAYTLTCKNSLGQTASKSVSVMVDGLVAPKPPMPTPADNISSPTDKQATAVVVATTGQKVVIATVTGEVTIGQLLSLEAATITDVNMVSKITRVEFYSGGKLIQTVTKAPFALNTALLKDGSQNITQRTYYKDGSHAELSQIVLVNAKKHPDASTKPKSRYGGVQEVLIITGLVVGGVIMLLFLTRVFVLVHYGYSPVVATKMTIKSVMHIKSKSIDPPDSSGIILPK